MKHTEGTWEVGYMDRGHGRGSFAVMVDSHSLIAKIDSFDNNNKANADLIASAPTMLAMLKDIRSFITQHGFDKNLIDGVIKQAEGGE